MKASSIFRRSRILSCERTITTSGKAECIEDANRGDSWNRKKTPREERISGFSAHADQNELFRWISSLTQPPRKVFITHGEKSAAIAFRQFLTDKTGWTCVVPEYEQDVMLD